MCQINRKYQFLCLHITANMKFILTNIKCDDDQMTQSGR